MAQDTYSNWLGPKPGIHSMTGKISPVGDFRPASPDSFEDDYDDVSVGSSDQGPPAKGVYLLAGLPGLNPKDSDPKFRDLGRSSQDLGRNSQDLGRNSQDLGRNSQDLASNSREFAPKSWDPDPKFRDLDPKFRDLDPKFRDVELNSRDLERNSRDVELNSRDLGSNSRNLGSNFQDLERNSRDPDPKSRDVERNSRNLERNSRNSRLLAPVAALALLLALSALGWAGLGRGQRQELRAELELLRSNLSGIWDSLQQTRLQFRTRQHQRELQELTAAPCPSPRCPPGWVSHSRSCFSFSRNSLSWERARGACGEQGAHLAVVSTQEEQVFLVEQGGRFRYWLGVTDAAQEGKWSWVTGEQPTVGFWDIWSPAPQRELKDCGALDPAGLWIPELCSEFLRWICEKPGTC